MCNSICSYRFIPRTLLSNFPTKFRCRHLISAAVPLRQQKENNPFVDHRQQKAPDHQLLLYSSLACRLLSPNSWPSNEFQTIELASSEALREKQEMFPAVGIFLGIGRESDRSLQIAVSVAAPTSGSSLVTRGMRSNQQLVHNFVLEATRPLSLCEIMSSTRPHAHAPTIPLSLFSFFLAHACFYFLTLESDLWLLETFCLRLQTLHLPIGFYFRNRKKIATNGREAILGHLPAA